jgi:sirohydrochlorin ferrochelatase
VTEGRERQRLPKSLERRRATYDPGAGEGQRPQCRSELHRIGEEIGERLEYVPASPHLIIEIHRATLDGWVMRVRELLVPIVAAMRNELLGKSYPQAIRRR